MKILVCGPKSSGKTGSGEKLAAYLGLDWIDTDRVLEDIHAGQSGEKTVSGRFITP
jgi:shikimate kinase